MGRAAVRMHLLPGGRLRMWRRIYYPGAAKGETFELPVYGALFRHPQANVLFDTGCHPDAARDGAARWGEQARYAEPIFDPEQTVAAQLVHAGLAPADIDVVVCSHLHYDHCGCNAFFPQATVMCHAREIEAAQAPDAAARGYLPGEWEAGARLQAFEGQRDLLGDGRLTLIPAPGHTPGMTVCHAVLDRTGPVLVASDAVPVGASLMERYAPRNTADVEACLRSMDEIARFAEDGAMILYGHDEAQWRELRKGADFYD